MEQQDIQDPREKGARPPFPAEPQQHPAHENKMTPRPDYGEKSYRGSGKLEGRAALITGADSGIGRAVAVAFAREGADVLVSYLNEHEDAQETARVVQEAGRRSVLVPGDIKDERHCRDLVERAFREFGHLEVVVNNAAFQMDHEDILEVTPQEWEATFRTNIHAMFYISRAAIPRMKPGSAIINTASIQAYKPSDFILPYATTKGAIVTFTKALSEYCLKRGIRVNAVAPGPVWTPLIVYGMPESSIGEFGKNSPLGRPAQPAELAPTYVLLACDDSSYISGEVIGVTGGKPLP